MTGRESKRYMDTFKIKTWMIEQAGFYWPSDSILLAKAASSEFDIPDAFIDDLIDLAKEAMNIYHNQ